MFLALFAVVAFSVVGFVVGLLSANQTRDGGKPGANDPKAACADACTQLQLRRSEVCIAASNARLATANEQRAATAHTAISVTLAILIVAAAALWASTLIPLIGLAAIPFAIAATVAVGLAVVAEAAALGALLGAQQASARAAREEADARTAEQAAIQIVLAQCGQAEADACLARPRPC